MNTSLIFNWTVTDNLDASLMCNLSIDGAVNQSGIVSANNTAVNVTVSSFNDGTYNWSVTCVDNASNINTTAVRNFTIDTILPHITLNSPSISITTSNTSLIFNWTVIDNLDSIKYCNLSINGTVNQSIESTNNSATNVTVSSFGYGTYWWNVTCIDNASNINTSITRNFTISAPDSTKPYIVLNYPNNVFFNTDTVNYNWKAYDNVDKSLSCKISIDGSVNESGIASPNGTATNQTVYNVAQGSHTWNVTCIDDNSNFNTSAPYNFTIDTKKPNIALASPTDSITTSNTSLVFNWTVTDNVDPSMMCNLTINGTVNQSRIVSTNNTAVNVTVTSFDQGTYFWNVTCIDNASNINTSTNRNFTISLVSPDTDKFSVKNLTNFVVASIDSAGYLFLKGTYLESQGTVVPPLNSFIIQNSTGQTIAYINSTGHLVLRGTISQSAPMTPSGTNLEFRNRSNIVVAFFDSLGNLKLKGTVNQNYPNP